MARKSLHQMEFYSWEQQAMFDYVRLKREKVEKVGFEWSRKSGVSWRIILVPGPCKPLRTIWIGTSQTQATKKHNL